MKVLIKREAKLLEDSKVIERIKHLFYKFVRNKRNDENNSERFKNKTGLTKCDQETAEVLKSEFQKVFTKTGLLTTELKELLQNKSVCFDDVKMSITSK